MIHYHGSPISGTKYDALKFYTGRHALVSFANPQHIVEIAEVSQTFVIDNGAFSEWKKTGGEIDVPAYANFVREWCQHPSFDWCLIPDKIDGTWQENRQAVFDWTGGRGHFFESVPVFHLHEPDHLLEEYVRIFKRIAIGSSGQYAQINTAQWVHRMKEVMRICCDEKGRPLVKLHGLRMLDPAVFSQYPFASADSCNAAVNAGSLDRFGIYKHPDSAGRASVIADRIERHNSASVFFDYDQGHLFELNQASAR